MMSSRHLGGDPQHSLQLRSSPQISQSQSQSQSNAESAMSVEVDRTINDVPVSISTANNTSMLMDTSNTNNTNINNKHTYYDSVYQALDNHVGMSLRSAWRLW